MENNLKYTGEDLLMSLMEKVTKGKAFAFRISKEETYVCNEERKVPLDNVYARLRYSDKDILVSNIIGNKWYSMDEEINSLDIAIHLNKDRFAVQFNETILCYDSEKTFEPVIEEFELCAYFGDACMRILFCKGELAKILQPGQEQNIFKIELYRIIENCLLKKRLQELESGYSLPGACEKVSLSQPMIDNKLNPLSFREFENE